MRAYRRTTGWSRAGVPGLEPRLTEPESVVLPITPYPMGVQALEPVPPENSTGRQVPLPNQPAWPGSIPARRAARQGTGPRPRPAGTPPCRAGVDERVVHVQEDATD